jgi:hypothetical protein
MVSYFVRYKTWLLRFLENEIYFKGRFGHKEGSEKNLDGFGLLFISLLLGLVRISFILVCYLI